MADTPETPIVVRKTAKLELFWTCRLYRAGRLLRIAHESELEAALSGCGAGH